VASVRSDILQNLQDLVAGLKTTGGYNYNWRNAYTRARTPENMKAYPSCNLLDGGQTYSARPSSAMERRWTVDIEAVHKVISTDDDDAQTVIDKMLEDLEKAVLVDHTRGGHAIDTSLATAPPSVNTEAADLVVVYLRVEIHYRTAYSNPATVR